MVEVSSVAMEHPTLPLFWLPVTLALWIPATYIITYSVAVSKGHVSAWLPSISATGALPPDSCWFSFLTNLTTFFLVVLGWLRQAALVARPRGRGWLAQVAGAVGLVACLALFVLANWQLTFAPLTHFVAAHVCFYSTALYFVLQSVASAHFSSPALMALKGCTSVLLLALVIAGDICYYKAFSLYTGEGPTPDPLRWSVDQPGGDWRLAATLLEWAWLLAVSLALLTLAPDFRNVRLHHPQIKMDETKVDRGELKTSHDIQRYKNQSTRWDVSSVHEPACWL